MTLPIARYSTLLRQYGLRRCLFRLGYSIRRRSGLLSRRFTPFAWADRPLACWLADESLAGGGLKSRIEKSSGEFFFPAGALPEITFSPPAQAIADADSLLSGTMKYFSALDVSNGFPNVRWHENSVHGKVAPLEHWTRLAELGGAIGDIKYFWEPARFTWAYTLCRAYAVSGDDKYPRAFWQAVESFIANNPPQMGVNWFCGQEIAIRTMACVFAMHAFWNSPESTDDHVEKLLTLIAASAHRIEKNIGYAISQRNNHSISEAAGLLTVGLVLPQFKDSRRWRELGAKVLRKSVADDFFADGSYIQHSMNYHRMVLQVLTWCVRLAELNRFDLGAVVAEKFQQAVDFAIQMSGGEGFLPNYGPNDGSLAIPLSDCDYRDYRPAMAAAGFCAKRVRIYEPGPWDEQAAWMFGQELLKTTPTRVQIKSSQFEAGGYYTFAGPGSWAMVRCHSYRTKPSQCDMLHFDLWRGGRNILCDSGTFSYNDAGGWGAFFESTASHNTVCINGVEQMDKGRRFQWDNPVQAGGVMRRASGDVEFWQGEHYGYRRLATPITHRRAICRVGDRWIVIDDLIGSGPASAELFWQMADLPCRLAGDTIELGGDADKIATMRIFCSSVGAEISVARGVESPRKLGWRSEYYGLRLPSPVLQMAVKCDLPARFITLIGFDSSLIAAACDVTKSIRWPGGDGGEMIVDLNLPSPVDVPIVRAIRAGSQTRLEI